MMLLFSRLTLWFIFLIQFTPAMFENDSFIIYWIPIWGMIYCIFIDEMWICFRLLDLKLTSCVHSAIWRLTFVCTADASVILDVMWSDKGVHLSLSLSLSLCVCVCVCFCHCVDEVPRYSEKAITRVRSLIHLKKTVHHEEELIALYGTFKCIYF